MCRGAAVRGVPDGEEGVRGAVQRPAAARVRRARRRPFRVRDPPPPTGKFGGWDGVRNQKFFLG